MVISKITDKLNGKIMTNFAALRVKIYTYRKLDVVCGLTMSEKKKCVS